MQTFAVATVQLSHVVQIKFM